MLEINRLPVLDLERLLELIGQLSVERQLDVHRTTILRWRSGQIKIPGAQHLAIQQLLGHLPGTDGQWEGWRFWKGKLNSPGGDQYGPGDVLSLVLLRQQLTAQRREIVELKARLMMAERSVQVSANENLAFG
jgi:hypothetical protein